jgi:hypothetical protein
MTDPMLQSGWETPGGKDLTQEQFAVLATSAQDAVVIGHEARERLPEWRRNG